VRRWLQKNSNEVKRRGIEWGLDEAFARVSSSAARSHFKNCGWT